MRDKIESQVLYRMIKELLKLPENISNKTVSVTVGGGMVEVIANYKQEIVNIKIDKEAVEDIDTLRALIVTGVNQALNKAKEELTTELIGKGVEVLFKDKE